jgi:DNA-binding transcriptional regulator YdaS (Cro superfamily)
MDMAKIVDWYGSKAAVARALGISAVAVTRWKDEVPPLRQLQLERMTKGALRADDSILDRPRQVA